MPPVMAHTSDSLCYPGGVATEQLVVGRCPEEPDDTEFHDKVVDKLLDLAFCVLAAFKVSLAIDIQKG